MDFIKFSTKELKNGNIELSVDFNVTEFNDLMIRGGAFYAIWDEEKKIWSTNETDVARLIDNALREEGKRLQEQYPNKKIRIRYLSNYSSHGWTTFKSFTKHMADNYINFDTKVRFKNDVCIKEDYATKCLPYSIGDGECNSFKELISTLYDPDERQKIEWAIGSIFAGDSVNIQKFMVLYGDSGTGKSTILKIIEKLFEGYTIMFDAKALGSSANQFATEPFHVSALVAIQHDGDLSRIEDNSKLNAIVSHEPMLVNEKYKSAYTITPRCFIFMATNKPVKITDAKSGLIRRLIDVKPSGRKINVTKYRTLMKQIEFELGSIAKYCVSVYKELGDSYYDGYRAVDMIYKTDVFFNFVEECIDIFSKADGIALIKAYDMFKQYCSDSGLDYKVPRYKFREELKNYFKEFHEKYWNGEKQIRSYYIGFLIDKFTRTPGRKIPIEEYDLIKLEDIPSILDDVCSDIFAQYATESGIPEKKWSEVTTKLKDLDTRRTHYILLNQDHIVIDFDLKNEDGEKSLEKNLIEANKWPQTYTEVSKSGKGIHLHYIYDGDPLELSRIYSEGIEVKVFTGNSALRRKLTLCNNKEISHISSGLPLKKGENMINTATIKSEKGLRDLIMRNLRKEIHPGTKPSMDFICKILTDAYNDGLKYDLEDMRQKVLNFAMKSTHQADYCMRLMSKIPFKSKDVVEVVNNEDYKEEELVFFDVEVFPNLFIVCWKIEGEGRDVVAMINPSGEDVEKLFDMKLVGFFNRDYDNHILYGRYLGYTNEELFNLSQKLVEGSNAKFREAYNISYTDVYDFSNKKQSLKKFEIELGIHHQELGLPWNKEVPKDLWDKVVEYCKNDVIATEAVFHARQEDYIARKILCDLSGLSINDTTNSHSTKIIFGEERNPVLVYTDLATGEQF